MFVYTCCSVGLYAIRDFEISGPRQDFCTPLPSICPNTCTRYKLNLTEKLPRCCVSVEELSERQKGMCARVKNLTGSHKQSCRCPAAAQPVVANTSVRPSPWHHAAFIVLRPWCPCPSATAEPALGSMILILPSLQVVAIKLPSPLKQALRPFSVGASVDREAEKTRG